MAKNTLLDTLFAELPAARFLNGYWPDLPCWCDGKPERLPAALRDPALSSIANLSTKYRGRISFGNARTGSRTVAVDHLSASMLLRMGLSLYLPELAQTLPGLGVLLREMEAALGIPPGSARIGAFVAPGENGVTCHFDAEEVISIQLIGRKRFYISHEKALEQPLGMQFNPGDTTFDDMYPQSGGGFPDPATASFKCVELKPGSVLFMPRGTWHRTETRETSLSISIILRPPSAMESVLDALRARMLQEPCWRRPLHGAWGTATARQAAERQLDELLKSLPELTGDLNLDDMLQTPLSESERLALIGPESRFQARPEASLQLQRDRDAMKAIVKAKDSEGQERETLQLEVPPAMISVFEWLARTAYAFGARTMAQQHANLPMDQHLRILHALVRGGYLKQLWFRSSAEQRN